MRQAAFFGVVVVSLAISILSGVALYREAVARNERIANAFVSACESTGGKAVWNFKYWECLK